MKVRWDFGAETHSVKRIAAVARHHGTQRRVVSNRELSDEMAADVYLARARQNEDIRAQHGPVRVLVRDGKPVGDPK